MNDQELKRLLEQATSDRSAPSLANSETKDAAVLRSTWQRFAAELTTADEQLSDDGADFLSRLEQSTFTAKAASLRDADASVPGSMQTAAIVACGRPADEPLNWKGWLALVASVAICGSAILWYDFDSASNVQQQTATVQPNAETNNSDAVASQRPAPPSQSNPEPREQVGAMASIDTAWTDPVDQAIAQASEQLASLQDTSRWDRSLAALEQYRESVEQEMNEWDL